MVLVAAVLVVTSGDHHSRHDWRQHSVLYGPASAAGQGAQASAVAVCPTVALQYAYRVTAIFCVLL